MNVVRSNKKKEHFGDKGKVHTFVLQKKRLLRHTRTNQFHQLTQTFTSASQFCWSNVMVSPAQLRPEMPMPEGLIPNPMNVKLHEILGNLHLHVLVYFIESLRQHDHIVEPFM